MLPLTAASVLGALIAGISSRWKKKNLVAIVLSMLFVCVIMIGSVGMSRMEETELEEIFLHMAELMRSQVGERLSAGVMAVRGHDPGKGRQDAFIPWNFNRFLCPVFGNPSSFL
ncbi:MAG: hypothetical protein PUJ54_05955 [Lachnospiraceae bacterium]|nr:hypothetical protein [Lachnospiraceae bacterium]MDY4117758.1 hypothetical protein [Lachnospiraceae bacterium]